MSTTATYKDLERRIQELELDVTRWKESAEALKEEHDFLDAVLSTADCLVVVLDRDGNIELFNKACEELSGYRFEEVKGEPFWNRLLVPEEIESVKAVFKELSAGQFPNRHENHWQTKHGSRRLVSWSNTALLGDDGLVTHVIGTGIDITEQRLAQEALRKSHRNLERRVAERTADLDRANAGLKAEISTRERAQRRLAESEERFRAFLDNSPALAYIKDSSGKHLYCNKALCDAWEITRESFIGTNAHDFLPPDAAKRIEAWDEDVKRNGVTLKTEDYSDDFDGQVRWWSEIKFPIRCSEGEDLIGGIVFDITERKQREEVLQAMKFTIDHALDRTAWIAPDGRFLYANEAGYKEMGFTPEELLSMRISDVDPNFPPEEWDRHYQEMKTVGSMRLETSQVDAKGQTHVIEVLSKHIKFGEKEFICSFGRDITERKKTEEAIEEQLLFERLIADIAKQLTETKPGQLQRTIDVTLRSLGTALNSERAFLSQLSEDGKILRHTNIWGAEGIDVAPELFESDLNTETPWIAQQIRRGLAINTGPGLAGLPDDAKGVRLWLEERGIKSGVVVPVWAEGGCLGMLGLDTMQEPREYPQEIVDRLRIVADMIGSTLQRVRVQERLQESLGEIKELRDRLEQENIYLREEIQVGRRHEEIVGKSMAVMEMLYNAEQVAETDTTVLILGETGTGKELLARAIHRMSPRGNHQMVKVNCAALPSTLIEAELFGREKGAYTGAMTRQIGRFEIADQSTIFLDEIGELPLELQAKLLRVLEEGEFERLGSPKTVGVDVRVVASTNRDLSKAVEEDEFREDLYHRLNVFSITVPPLRERKEDIPLLVWSFAREFERGMGKRIENIRRDTMARLSHYSWPGNVRELRNVIERAMILSRGSTLRVETLDKAQPSQDLSNRTLQEVERTHILEVLGTTGWRVSGNSGAAEILGLKPTTLEARMKKLGIKRPA
jgi:PAS domain S-box-containing protein